MKDTRILFNKKMILMIVFVCFIVTAAIAFGNKIYKNTPTSVTSVEASEISSEEKAFASDNKISKVILNVRDMSCSGCISTIKDSLAGFSGIKDILVDIGGGRAEIYYDNNLLKDVNLVAEAITNAGYPAEVLKILSPDELKKENEQAKVKAQYYIASVGGWEIARNDFETELDSAKKKYSKIYGETLFSSAQGEALLANLKYQITSRLLDEGVIMQEITKSDYKLDKETIEKEFQLYLEKAEKSPEALKAELSEIGYSWEYFKKKFETKVLINQYINEKVLADTFNPLEKQNTFSAWFNNSKVLSEVVYYDKDIENLILTQSASSGCGVKR